MASPGEPIPINIKPVKVNAMILGGTEIRQAAQRLRNISVGGVSGIRAKDVKGWLQAAIAAEMGEPQMGDENAEEN